MQARHNEERFGSEQEAQAFARRLRAYSITDQPEIAEVKYQSRIGARQALTFFVVRWSPNR